MNEFFKKMKGTFQNIAADKAIPVPVTADQLLWLFRKGVREQGKDVHNLDVVFHDGMICISGLTKRLIVPVYFEIGLQPLKAEQRMLYFTVPYMRPFNQGWMKSKVLNKPPYAIYENSMLRLNLNEIDTIQAVPVGSIKHFEIKEGKLWVKIGI